MYMGLSNKKKKLKRRLLKCKLFFLIIYRNKEMAESKIMHKYPNFPKDYLDKIYTMDG